MVHIRICREKRGPDSDLVMVWMPGAQDQEMVREKVLGLGVNLATRSDSEDPEHLGGTPLGPPSGF